MRKRLGLFEKAELRRQCLENQKGSTFFDKDIVEYRENLRYSPFMSSELALLDVNTRFLFERHWCIVKLWKDTCSPYYRIMPLSKALSQIEARIGQIEVGVRELSFLCEVKAQNDLISRQKAKEKGESHLEVMYNDRLSVLEEQLKGNIMVRYRAILYLYGEKIRLLKNAFVHYDTLRSRHFLRIQYHYQMSYNLRRGKSYVPLNMADYDEMIDSSIPDRFHKEMEQTMKNAERLTAKLRRFSESQKGDNLL